ncbi:MAG TPA: OmpH family outer membrane protein [Dysgonamonadaceae bacterium]|jgi:outer membrane protein|nr:OmpH family outer membrane protein [Dysgonamonadaceae bacterium]MDD3728030.1 OmpH family outer membrane protein [Dysgonamonadaceae bacterium]MDD4606269.1 OmpH family outer membrane protein [Dysgonamonadaceae bacterium]HUI32205.1 OmpH family outer membrane protein [Dysgonamonadaceae bacterium]
MAKRFFLTIMVLATVMCVSTLNAQNSVAYVNTHEIINSLPDKTSATERLNTLSENYKKELQIMQNEYNKKYSDFITYQGTLAESIKLRRMQELTDLENRIQNFTKLAQQDIEEHEQQLLEPIKEKVKDAIKAVGIEQNFTVIYDLDDPGIVFVSPNAVDANQLVKSKLGVR